MELKKKRQLSRLPIGSKIQFVNDKTIICGNHQIAKGSMVTLTKLISPQSKSAFWGTNLMKWPLKLIPSRYEII